MNTQLTYRLFQDDDLPQLLTLWEQETGWGALTAEEWRAWYLKTPYGPCLISVAVDSKTNAVVGQMVMTPSRVVVDGGTVNALRLSAPILHKSLRRVRLRSLDHPIIGLYSAARNAAAEHGYQVVYSLPDHAWLPFFQWLPVFGFADSEYSCMESPLLCGGSDELPSREFALHREPVVAAEYELVWRDAMHNFPVHCGVVRSTEWVRFKNGGHILLALRERTSENTLVGYSATRKDGLIVDILAKTTDLMTIVLAETQRWMSDPAHEVPFPALKAMRTPRLAAALDALGFESVPYDFAFVCESIAPDLPSSAIAPAKWYLTPGD